MTGVIKGIGAAHAGSQSLILDVIRAAGQISRVELTSATGLTAATVSTVVRRLIDEQLVVEVGRAESTGGKPRVLLELNPASRFAVGVHLDHAEVTYVILNLGGAVVARWVAPGVGSEDPELVVARIAQEVRQLIARSGVDPSLILGLGVVSPGPLAARSAMLLTPPHMQHWADFPLATRISAALNLPVVLDNDATAAAVCEYWAGESPNATALAVLYMGSGIGAGIITGGTVYRGASSNAGEIGHICVDIAGPQCWCGSKGCIEVFSGPGAVVAEAEARGLQLGSGARGQKFAEVARQANAGNELAAELLSRSAQYLAIAAQTLANVLDLDTLVLTGPAFATAGDYYLPVIEDRLAHNYFARGDHSIALSISKYAFGAAAVGAAALVLQSELVPRQRSTPLYAARA